MTSYTILRILQAALPVELASETGHPCPLAEAIQPDPGRLVPRVGVTTGRLLVIDVGVLSTMSMLSAKAWVVEFAFIPGPRTISGTRISSSYGCRFSPCV